MAYLDDTIIFSKSAESTSQAYIQIVLTRLKQAKLRLQEEQMLVLQARASLSGALANHEWHQTAVRKDKGYIRDEAALKNQKGVREFLGMVGYYRKFINRFTDAARSMTKLTRKGVKFEWTYECQIGFNYLKTCLTVKR